MRKRRNVIVNVSVGTLVYLVSVHLNVASQFTTQKECVYGLSDWPDRDLNEWNHVEALVDEKYGVNRRKLWTFVLPENGRHWTHLVVNEDDINIRLENEVRGL